MEITINAHVENSALTKNIVRISGNVNMFDFRNNILTVKGQVNITYKRPLHFGEVWVICDENNVISICNVILVTIDQLY
jgi:hypothetical protein